ncbi:MAG: serine hydrolase [Chloroflexi bacterium]|nr:serine hydrolase [Chloroflexota bacterium]
MLNIVSPASVGLDATQLNRIAPHLDRYVDEGKLPGYLVMVARHGKPAYLRAYGLCDVENQKPMAEDTIFRIYSMTKPITSVAIMQLYARGLFQLDTPVSRFIPAFKDLRVFVAGNAEKYETTAASRPVTFRDLLTHTAGFAYGTSANHVVDTLYRERKILSGTLEEMIQKLGELPLLFTPGTRWSYSAATDILGHLVELISGQSLDAYFAEEILGPLGMEDTAFYVPDAKAARFAANYTYHEGGMRLIDSPDNSPYRQPPTFRSGGGGLVSTLHDYFRFAQMLLNKGELDGVRILGRKSVELMTMNHMPNNGDLSSMGMPVFSETPYDGIGFGLGFSVMLNPAQAQILGSPGEYSWGGAASTAFWIDPVEEQIVIFLTQLMPSSTYPIRRALRVLTYGAIGT